MIIYINLQKNELKKKNCQRLFCFNNNKKYQISYDTVYKL